MQVGGLCVFVGRGREEDGLVLKLEIAIVVKATAFFVLGVSGSF